MAQPFEDRARQLEMSAIWVDASQPATHRLEQLGYRIHDDYKKTVNGVVFYNNWMIKRFT